MKSLKLSLAAFALFISAAAFSQTDSTRKDSTRTGRDTTTTRKDTTTQKKTPGESATLSTTPESAVQQSQPNTTQSATPTTQATSGAANNGTTTTSSATSNSTSSAPKPNFGRYYIAVLGTYQSAQADVEKKSVVITPDESNPGKVWVEGLTDTKFYALLKTAPGTYKIPAQTQENNKIQEGTLVYQEDSKQVNICLGCGYNTENPSEMNATPSVSSTDVAVASPKVKNKKSVKEKKVSTVINFSGVKTDQGTASVGQ